jgi:hypothetical protein
MTRILRSLVGALLSVALALASVGALHAAEIRSDEAQIQRLFAKLRGMPPGLARYSPVKAVVIKLIGSRPQKTITIFRVGSSRVAEDVVAVEDLRKATLKAIRRSTLTAEQKVKFSRKLNTIATPGYPGGLSDEPHD